MASTQAYCLGLERSRLLRWRHRLVLLPTPSPIYRDLMKPRQHQDDDADSSQVANENPPRQQVPGALTPVLERQVGERGGYASQEAVQQAGRNSTHPAQVPHPQFAHQICQALLRTFLCSRKAHVVLQAAPSDGFLVFCRHHRVRRGAYGGSIGCNPRRGSSTAEAGYSVTPIGKPDWPRHCAGALQ